MNKNFVEAAIGLIVLIVAFSFFYMAYKTTDLSVDGGYLINAKFDRVDGLNVGSDVKVGGIKVGRVISFKLDQKTYQAYIQMEINNEIKLPTDTSAEIVSNGLIGEKYVALVPGSDNEEFLANNSHIDITQSAISLEALIGKFMFSTAEKSAKEDEKK
jgi:phospholipid/cholesterol/gamma-HCH transport system substrate-binding protein